MPVLTAQKASFEKLLSDPSMESASVSFCVVDANKGDILFQYDENAPLIPASVLKLITSATALDILGGEHTFTTALYYSGELDRRSGELQGDIIIMGGGDPVLGSERFAGHYGDIINRWANDIQQYGIKSISGRIITDDSYFDYDPVPGEWLWEDIGNYYGAGVYGLSIFDNTYKIHFITGSEGSVPLITSISREGSGIELKNGLTAKGATDMGYIFAAPYSYTGWISGTIPENKTDFVLKGAITDPPLLAAKMLEDTLRSAKIDIGGKASTVRLSGNTTKENLTLISKTTSPPLKDIIYILNHESVNLYAETLVKEIAKESGSDGTTVNGIKEVEKYLTGKGIWDKGTNLTDGSGLSPRNRINALTLTKLLVSMKLSPEGKDFVGSLPYPGENGTIKSIFQDEVFRKNLRVKSGSMDGIRSFAGYFTARSGRELAFTIIINNFTGPSSRVISTIESVLEECILIY